VSKHVGLFLGGNVYRGVAMSDYAEQRDLLAERVGGTWRAGYMERTTAIFSLFTDTRPRLT